MRKKGPLLTVCPPPPLPPLHLLPPLPPPDSPLKIVPMTCHVASGPLSTTDCGYRRKMHGVDSGTDTWRSSQGGVVWNILLYLLRAGFRARVFDRQECLAIDTTGRCRQHTMRLVSSSEAYGSGDGPAKSVVVNGALSWSIQRFRVCETLWEPNKILSLMKYEVGATKYFLLTKNHR